MLVAGALQFVGVVMPFAGGGQVLYCIGTYVKRGNKFVGELHARKHAKSGKTSPILGMDEFHMRLEGTFHGGYGQIDGKIVELPNVPKLRGNFLRISAL